MNYKAFINGEIYEPFCVEAHLTGVADGYFDRRAVFLLGSGIPDKEGKEIFQNDLVRDDNEDVYTVRFGEFKFHGAHIKGWYTVNGKSSFPLSSKDSKYLKIVGNELTQK